MKHAELIIAALDGKTIQYKYPTQTGRAWNDFLQPTAISCLAQYPDIYEYRIKPEPVPDKVRYGAVYRPDKPTVGEFVPESPSDWAKGCRQCAMVPVKLTIKMDENGVETEHVEIVK